MDDIIVVGDFDNEVVAKAQCDRLAEVMRSVTTHVVTVSEPFSRPTYYDWAYTVSVGERPRRTNDVDYLRAREEQAAELLESWFNVASNVVGAPKQDTLEWLAKMAPRP